MKSVLLVVCALGFGLFPGIASLSESAVLIVLGPVFLGLIYFVFWRHDWPSELAPWLCACVAVGRVAAYWWLNARYGRHDSLVDQEVWIFGGLAAVSVVYRLYQWMNGQSGTPTSPGPKSALVK